MFGTWNLLNELAGGSYPAFNLHAGSESATLVSEVPGIEPESVDVSVEGDVLTLSFERHNERKDGEQILRQERPFGKFKRRIKLPYAVESDEVRATVQAGVLKVELPRAKEERPRKIEVRVA